MDYIEALESLKTHRHYEKFVLLCADSNPDAVQRDSYRELVIRKVQGVPMLERVANFAGAMIESAKTGFKTVSEDEQKKRLAICEECIFFNKEKRTCTLCTCQMDFKTRLAASECPKGYWSKSE